MIWFVRKKFWDKHQADRISVFRVPIAHGITDRPNFFCNTLETFEGMLSPKLRKKY